MVAALVDQARAITGYERERYLLRNVDAIGLPLRWGEKDTRALAGKKIRRRFHLRSAGIHSAREAAN